LYGNTPAGFASSAAIALPEIGGGSLGYTYNITSENLNHRTIRGFSTEAEEKMLKCKACPYPDFAMFDDYYGRPDYADHIIDAAFKGNPTELSEGNMNFGSYTDVGKAGTKEDHHICWTRTRGI
jgi:hypothetical protein